MESKSRTPYPSRESAASLEAMTKRIGTRVVRGYGGAVVETNSPDRERLEAQLTEHLSRWIGTLAPQSVRELVELGAAGWDPFAEGSRAEELSRSDLAPADSAPPELSAKNVDSDLERRPLARDTAAAIHRALARGEESMAAILQREDMLTGEAVGARLNTTRETINAWRHADKLLALEFGPRGLKYPSWQLAWAGDPERRRAYTAILQRLKPRGAWSAYRFFTTATPSLGGRRPIDALDAGHEVAVLQAAETWAAGEHGGG